MIPSNASHCGSSTTMGHGDFAICGQPYYDGIYQCNGCQIKALKAIIGRCHEAIGENAGSDDDTLPESIAMHVMQRSERIAELEAAASARSERVTNSPGTRIAMRNGDVQAEVKGDDATKEAVFAKLLTFFNEHRCWSGESYCQCDGPQIGSMEMMCDLLDLLDAKVVYD